jgi:ribose 5-phosphate isomerase B
MRIALGADHAGVALKDDIRQHLERRGHACTDFGTRSTDRVDYPDIAAAVGQAIADGAADRGVLVCGSGLGMALAANKIPGVRAAAVGDAVLARLARAHNDANVLALGARLLTPAPARHLVDLFLDTPFDGGRHQRRLDKIRALDEGRTPAASQLLEAHHDSARRS